MIAQSTLKLLRDRFRAAIGRIGGDPDADPGVRVATEARFGDFQCNAAMALARKLGLKPPEAAQRIVAAVAPELAEVVEPLEIANPGFINIRLRTSYLARCLESIEPPAAGAEDRLGLPKVAQPERVIVDYSSPNIAKQMHVGHLRSTIIGDAFVRVLGFQGHDVLRQNHIGDWGTAIGMVILGLWYIAARLQRGERPAEIEKRIAELHALRGKPDETRQPVLERIAAEWSLDLENQALDDFADADIQLEQLELGYIFVQALVAAIGPLVIRVKRDDLIAVPQKVTRMLQQGGPENELERRAWRRAREISVAYCQSLYDRLGVLLKPEDFRGESAYNDDLPRVITDLRLTLKPRDRSRPAADAYGELRIDQGATCVYLYDAKHQPRFKNPDGQELPMIVQKSDGAYLYATTDLAAIRYRLMECVFPAGKGATRIVYVTDARQKQHFEMFLAAARALGWLTPRVNVQHATFGSVLGEDKRPLKTRAGKNVKLAELLDEAESRALRTLDEKLDQETGPQRGPLDEAQRREIARRIGVGAVKYSDLVRDRNSDYVFSFDAMLAMEGNTAPYMLYAYARIRSIYRKVEARLGKLDPYGPDVRISLDRPEERTLALRLVRFADTLDIVAADLAPHVLCSYLFDLAGEFMRFFEACPVLQAESDSLRLSRMRLCDLTARTLRVGLGLLGIEPVERM
ncbi:MAG: arginine--tRNA ligase [Planctomycetes bacterium]|nr:arginine--tRNA ligase [Planctomycetota bacterium]